MNSPKGNLFKHVAFIVYPVADVKRARAFYEDVLDLAVTANWDDQWVEYDIGDTTLAITIADQRHRAGAPGACLGLEVVDFDAVLAHLAAKSVPIVDGPTDSPSCRGGVIRDPDNNEIILHARK